MKFNNLMFYVLLFICQTSWAFTPVLDDSTRKAPANWFNLDYVQDGVPGISTERAYKELLQGKKSNTVLVAVIDSGIDIEHEDLKPIIWINTKEVAGNGVDDDKNGFVDDMYGWNFIGGKDGRHVNGESLELTREYARLRTKYEGNDGEKNAKKNKEEFEYYQSVKNEYQAKLRETNEQVMQFQMIADLFKKNKEILQNKAGVQDMSSEALAKVESKDPEVTAAKDMMNQLLGYGLNEEEIKDAEEYLSNMAEYGCNLDFDSRAIVGDNPEDFREIGYGNNDVIGPDAKHGTHVAGIIGAIRENNMGIKGVSDDVRIMVIRCVPNGDERDKDVANAIRYAADNGAKIVNMSFGKSYSPQKEVVDEAVQYAMSKGVLLVHAAGNDAKDIDLVNNFPSKNYMRNKGKAENWIEVGALNWGKDGAFVADFTNYGKTQVDVFAPGVDLYSSVPGSQYSAQSGTSMACPVVSGMAAVLWSYFPQLTAAQVKEIIIKSAVSYAERKVTKPGAEMMVPFGDLSNTGAVVNLYEAIKLAEQIGK